MCFPRFNKRFIYYLLTTIDDTVSVCGSIEIKDNKKQRMKDINISLEVLEIALEYFVLK